MITKHQSLPAYVRPELHDTHMMKYCSLISQNNLKMKEELLSLSSITEFLIRQSSLTIERDDIICAACSLISYSAIHGRKPPTRLFNICANDLFLTALSFSRNFSSIMKVIFNYCIELCWLKDLVSHATVYPYLKEMLMHYKVHGIVSKDEILE